MCDTTYKTDQYDTTDKNDQILGSIMYSMDVVKLNQLLLLVIYKIPLSTPRSCGGYNAKTGILKNKRI